MLLKHDLAMSVLVYFPEEFLFVFPLFPWHFVVIRCSSAAAFAQRKNAGVKRSKVFQITISSLCQMCCFTAHKHSYRRFIQSFFISTLFCLSRTCTLFSQPIENQLTCTVFFFFHGVKPDYLGNPYRNKGSIQSQLG